MLQNQSKVTFSNESCSKVAEVALFGLMLKYANCTTKVRSLIVFGVTSVAIKKLCPQLTPKM